MSEVTKKNKNAKRKHVSPEKGKDSCAACSVSLDESSSALECDDCSRWMCSSCLNLTSMEYDLVNKMTMKIGCNWSCTLCKLNLTSAQADAAATASEVKAIIESSMASLKVGLKKDLDDISANLQANIQSISAKVTEVEKQLATKCSLENANKLVSDLVATEIRTVQSQINETLDSEVWRILRSEKDREKRRLNLIAYGIPLQSDEATFISDYLCKEYGLAAIHIANTKRLSPPGNPPSTSDVAARPPPVIFTVQSFDVKKQILQKSVLSKGDIRFHGDESKDDRAKRKLLKEEMRSRTAAGESDLVIRNLKIVSKNSPAGSGQPALPRDPNAVYLNAPEAPNAAETSGTPTIPMIH